MPPKLTVAPPLLNAACPWATTESDLRALLLCPHTGAVTTRTSMLAGFPHRDDLHHHRFFDPATTTISPSPPHDPPASINSFGYSPIPLPEYLAMLAALLPSPALAHAPPKTVILSIASDPADVASALALVAAAAPTHPRFPLAVEINLSCPNIPHAPPPAYAPAQLSALLAALPARYPLPLGVKLPPYTHALQFEDLAAALNGPGGAAAAKLSFVTATNTLGSCLLFLGDGDGDGDGDVLRGGLAGVPIHALSLGNVAALRALFDAHPALSHLDVVGVGGVHDRGGFERMRRAGAAAVGIATALGSRGLAVFEEIATASPSVL